jgi:cilla- and flagella-associated protein
MQELYLRKNCISDLKEIRYLIDLPYLKSLWLYDNPCAQIENYREIVIHHLPNLTKLDNSVVTQEERIAANHPKFEIDFTTAQVKDSFYQNTPEVAKRSDAQTEGRKSRPFSELQREERTSQVSQASQEPVWKGSSNK